MIGRYCRVEPLDAGRRAAELHEANSEDVTGEIWTYLPYGPFADLEDYRGWLNAECTGHDPLFHAVIDETGKAGGVAAFLRIDRSNGAIEVGHIAYSPRLQRSRAGTEAIYLMMRRVFEELRYRRCEWKCDALNQPSRAAAERLGFTYEGSFRQAAVYKGRNRDTAWYSVVDQEWPALRAAFESWLEPSNFDAGGRQQLSLSTMTRAALPGRAPAR